MSSDMYVSAGIGVLLALALGILYHYAKEWF